MDMIFSPRHKIIIAVLLGVLIPIEAYVIYMLFKNQGLPVETFIRRGPAGSLGLLAGVIGMAFVLLLRLLIKNAAAEDDPEKTKKTIDLRVREQTAALLEREKFSALGEVSAGLAHEIKNPLSAILSGMSLLESGKRTEAERERIVKLVKREVGRLNSSLTDFLLFARPQHIKRVRIDLNGLVRDIARLVEEDPEIGTEAQITLELSELPAIWFDDEQLRQLIWNVVLNGIQAMEGKGRLVIRTGKEGQDWWRLEVEDTGTGIPEEIRDRIYDPFFSTKKDGTGLGLSIVDRIVRAGGGDISIESASGKGCKFIITAPISKRDENPHP
jgi:two-component system sensor histidine kinase PilS (NtrC family)